ncbi:hypothetical protein F5X68DRAFT_214311 [Plectosphaerella plurivora]|uniref:Uncharacterized protein n=1 Tax=Plectosphaerella plurivora TaxID=936078 RepID=A0A9P9A6V6_9PEZI|nr:hypothetical protein F5X68DRAFT_214311 [Plectosphaerella plurivora]
MEKSQPWKKNWPPADDKSCPDGIEYGVKAGETAVVDGTAANIKPQKIQPWKAAWPPAASQNPSSSTGIEYGAGKGDTVVVDGTAANIKPTRLTLTAPGSRLS